MTLNQSQSQFYQSKVIKQLFILMKKFPAIVFDIDGVIVRGKQIINSSDQVVESIMQKPYIPFYLLTNGERDSQNKTSNLQKEQVILNFTPLRQIMSEFQNRLLLVCGTGKIREIAEDCGLQQFITSSELQTLRNKSHFKTYTQSQIDEIKEIIAQRGVTIDQKFEAVFIVNDPNEWENDFQQIIDILRVDINTPIYVVNNDFTYADVFWLPRVAFGLFNASLRSICQQRFGKEPNIMYYGKPSTNTFKYVENLIHQQNPNVGNIYMIGDNPKSDIRGANNIGWISILVRTGVFQGVNDPVDPAKHVVSLYKIQRLMICLKKNLTYFINKNLFNKGQFIILYNLLIYHYNCEQILYSCITGILFRSSFLSIRSKQQSEYIILAKYQR
ncbi:hypothetical protein pb186bvf_007230 [Paramecium bursaria]